MSRRPFAPVRMHAKAGLFPLGAKGEGEAIELIRRLWQFTGRVWGSFRRHKVLLLASAVAYNTLLSVIPLFAVLLVGLSHVFEEAQLLSIVEGLVSQMAPGQGSVLTGEIASFLDSRELLGWGGAVVSLFFSSMAFRMLEDSMAVIFGRNRAEARRFWVSAIIPYVYILVVGFGVVCLTLLTTVLDRMEGRDVVVLGMHWAVSTTPSVLLGVFGFVGMVAMFTSVYVVMPTARVGFKRALIGGVTAAILWEIVRRVLVWYFENLSLVSVVYGSLASVVIVLLCLEIASIITLLGAQVIAELERSQDAGVAWYEEPEELSSGASSAPGAGSGAGLPEGSPGVDEGGGQRAGGG